MKNNVIWWIIGIVIVVGLGYLVFSQPSKTSNKMVKSEPTAPKAEETITIGWMGPLTGDAAVYGLPLQKATMLAVEEVNAAGGVGGKKLAVVYEDSKCDGKEGSTAAQKLVNVYKVKVVIGGACSGETLGGAPIFNENKVVVLSPSASSPDITAKGGEYVFRTYPSDAMAGEIAAKYAADTLKAKSAAVISENTDYAQALHRVFVENFKKVGGTIGVEEVYNTGTTDFRTQALKFKNAKVDVVYIVAQSSAPGVAIVKALKDQKIEGKILSSETLMDAGLAKDSGEIVDGVTGIIAYYDEKSAPAMKFAQAYKVRFNEEVTWPVFSANAYSEVFLIKELIEKYGNDGPSMQKALAAPLTGWSGGILTNVTLDKNGDIVWHDFSIKQIKGGKLEQIGIFKF